MEVLMRKIVKREMEAIVSKDFTIHLISAFCSVSENLSFHELSGITPQW